MYLRSKDKIRLAILMFLFSIGSIVGWFVIHQAVLLISLTVGIFLIGIIQMENYRRTQDGLKQVQQSHGQIESLFYLYSTLKFKHPLPKMRGWAISPDFANTMISLIRERKPKLVVEAGSGVSTLVTAYCLQEIGQGRVVALDHDEHFAKVSAITLIKHQLQSNASILYAPLKKIALQGKPWLWYDITKLRHLGSIDMLIIDGPPSTTQKMARYPALPMLFHLLSENAVILLDDAHRPDEREMLKVWLKEFPHISIEEIDAEKGAVILRNQMTAP